MFGSGGRECVQVFSSSQESPNRMQGPALSLAGRATTTVTVHTQGAKGNNTHHGSSITGEGKDKSPYLPQNKGVSQGSYANNDALLNYNDSSRCATNKSVCMLGGGVMRHDNDNTLSSSDDLTSLSWLHSLDMGGMVPHLATPPTPPASPQPHNPFPAHTANMTPTDRKRKVDGQEKPDRIDYSQDGSAKPPYSYAALIGMAMKENQNKMTLSAIYKWIKENFAYYKTADPSWQVSG